MGKFNLDPTEFVVPKENKDKKEPVQEEKKPEVVKKPDPVKMEDQDEPETKKGPGRPKKSKEEESENVYVNLKGLKSYVKIMAGLRDIPVNQYIRELVIKDMEENRAIYDNLEMIKGKIK